MKKLYFLIFILLFLFNPTSYADTPENNLKQKLENLTTYTADFNQIIENRQGDILQTSKGTMALNRPGLFRWDTVKPNQQLIIADGKFLWIDDKDLEQVTQQKQTINRESPGLLLSDSVDNLAKQFIITSPNDNLFNLRPRAKNRLFKSIQLLFDSSGALIHMILYDNLNQITVIQFSHYQINPVLSPSLFKFTPSKNICPQQQ